MHLVTRSYTLSILYAHIRCVEQPEAIARALNFGGRMSSHRVLLGGLDSNYDKISRIRFMTLSACGTSLNAARYGELLMKQLGSFDSVCTIDAAETDAKDFPATLDPKEVGVIVVSQSGETKDVQRVVQKAQDKGICVMSVVNSVGSLIARTTKLGVYCHAGRENAVACTKAFTTEVTVLALIALWYRNTRDKLSGSELHSVEASRLQEALMRLPISFGMALKTRDRCREIAEELKDKEHCFVLGKGAFDCSILRRRNLFLGYMHSIPLHHFTFQATANQLLRKVHSSSWKCAIYMLMDTAVGLSSMVRLH